jgi:hypothetical protein
MSSNTSYGTVANYLDVLTVEDMVSSAITQDVEDFDLDAIAADWRASVNAALPEGVSLNGDGFFGPWPMADGAAETIALAIESVDLWSIVEHNDTSTTAETAVAPDATQGTVLDALNLYVGDDVWGDVIYGLDYDEDATRAVATPDDRDVVIGGTHYRLNEGTWRVA